MTNPNQRTKYNDLPIPAPVMERLATRRDDKIRRLIDAVKAETPAQLESYGSLHRRAFAEAAGVANLNDEMWAEFVKARHAHERIWMEDMS